MLGSDGLVFCVCHFYLLSLRKGNSVRHWASMASDDGGKRVRKESFVNLLRSQRQGTKDKHGGRWELTASFIVSLTDIHSSRGWISDTLDTVCVDLRVEHGCPFLVQGHLGNCASGEKNVANKKRSPVQTIGDSVSSTVEALRPKSL